MELNGLANLHILVDQLDHLNDHKQQAIRAAIKQQLDLLERYMVAYANAYDKVIDIPAWHEVRENPKGYPLNRER